MGYKIKTVDGELREYAFDIGGVLALRNFTATTNGNRLIIQSLENANFTILDALVNEVEVDGVVYDDVVSAQEALQRLVFNPAIPTIITKELRDLIFSAIQPKTNGSDIHFFNEKGELVELDLSKKVDKVIGKQLSTNDFTNQEKQKLEGLVNYVLPQVLANIEQNDVNAWNDAKDKKIINLSITGDVNKMATITFADGTTLQDNFEDIGTDTEIKLNSLNFDISTGVVTAVTSDGATITENFDGRYALLGHTHTISDIQNLQNELNKTIKKKTSGSVNQIFNIYGQAIPQGVVYKIEDNSLRILSFKPQDALLSDGSGANHAQDYIGIKFPPNFLQGAYKLKILTRTINPFVSNDKERDNYFIVSGNFRGSKWKDVNVLNLSSTINTDVEFVFGVKDFLPFIAFIDKKFNVRGKSSVEVESVQIEHASAFSLFSMDGIINGWEVKEYLNDSNFHNSISNRIEISGEDLLPNAKTQPIILADKNGIAKSIINDRKLLLGDGIKVNQASGVVELDEAYLIAKLNSVSKGYKFKNLSNDMQLSAYKHSVIALCELDNDVEDFDSWTGGQIFAHRNNAAVPGLFLEFLVEKKYNTTGLRAYLSKNISASNIKICTFTYNSRKYGGIHFFYNNANYHNVFINYEGNFVPFALDYKRLNGADETIINSEIYNSLIYPTTDVKQGTVQLV
ncbi:hypothetical protein TMFC_140027 [Tenacibaculum maritimum]|uniref:hypothetical protein n=1 Tax=Tenacibaculum maritimum TaxID=107401 RepID=UPI0012E49CE4|nr:hypothetical protein [Tenacibaculum maritimum]CAA0169981.1 hypothetical protein TMFC_140027 [Tenacibaculum maritimum]